MSDMPSENSRFVRRRQSRKEERINAITHGAMAVMLFIAAPLTIIHVIRPVSVHSLKDAFATAVFIICLILMFTTSAVYHALPAGSHYKNFWNRLDHIAIFLAIAGSYTPVALSVIGGRIGWFIFGFEWMLVLVGILFKTFHFKKNRVTWILSIMLYLLMGWAVVLYLPVYMSRAQAPNLWLIFSGGLFYTIGILFFAQKWRYSHVVWHGFVMAGALSHFVAIVFFLR